LWGGRKKKEEGKEYNSTAVRPGPLKEINKLPPSFKKVGRGR